MSERLIRDRIKAAYHAHKRKGLFALYLSPFLLVFAMFSAESDADRAARIQLREMGGAFMSTCQIKHPEAACQRKLEANGPRCLAAYQRALAKDRRGAISEHDFFQCVWIRSGGEG